VTPLTGILSAAVADKPIGLCDDSSCCRQRWMISGINSLNLAGIVNLYHWLTPPLCQSYRAVALGILHFVWSLFTMHAHTKNNNYVLYLWCACTVDNSFPKLIHSATVIDRGLQCTDMVRHQIAGSFSTNIQVINKSNDEMITTSGETW